MAVSPVALALSLLTQPTTTDPTAVPAWQPTAEVTAAEPAPPAVPATPPPATPPPAAAPPPDARAELSDLPPRPQPGATNPDEDPPDTRPVIRAKPGNWGMTFIFGGLAPLSVGGLGDLPLADGVMFTEIGVRRVFKRVVIPFSFGAGASRVSTTGQTPAYSAGVSASVAVLKGFRVWRRIAPYAGAFLHMHYIDARGPDNWLVNVSVGPILGIEYFIADRVSLYGQGIFGVGPNIGKNTIHFVARATMAAGGQLGLTFYF